MEISGNTKGDLLPLVMLRLKSNVLKPDSANEVMAND